MTDKPVTALNLEPLTPKTLNLNHKTIKLLAVIILLIVLFSIFIIMRQAPPPATQEEALIFEHLTPKVAYPKIEEAKIPNLPQAVVPEHNSSSPLLTEYFAEQAVLKLQEEEAACKAPIAFNLTLTNLTLNPKENLLQAGTIIPCVLANAINSDLPGMVMARVKEPVFDSLTHQTVLIPQGSLLMGFYNNQMNVGQERLELVFHRLTIGTKTMELDNLLSYDLAGQAGLPGKVTKNYGKVALGVSLATLLAASNPTLEASPYPARATNSAHDNLSDLAHKFTKQQMAKGPTIMIKAGVPFNIILAKDLLI